MVQKAFIFQFILLTLIFIETARASVNLGGFLDTYYAWDFDHPDHGNRSFTTQPVKHQEASINLAHIDATLVHDKYRGRIALQLGDSAKRNTETETSRNTQHIQESYVGAKFGNSTWIDAGIFLGNIGAESWISKDNWTYSRALNLDYVPYYSAGLRIEHALSDKQSFQLHLINGWQNISDKNDGKAVGMQFKNQLTGKHIFTYNNFLGDEGVVSSKSRFRGYHNFILQWLRDEKWNFLGALDVAHQSQQQNDGVDGWFATTLTIRRILNPMQSIAMRIEYYCDPHEANLVTATPNGFQVLGASMNFDQRLGDHVLWRTEIRGFNSKDKIYPQSTKYQSRWDRFAVTSLSAWF